MKKICIFVLAGAMLLSSTGYSSLAAAKTSSKKTVTVKKLKFKKKKVTVKVGKKVKLPITVSPKKATVSFTSKKKSVAAVSKKGVVKGKKAGTAKIVAKAGKKKATIKVVVKSAGSATNATEKKYNLTSVRVLSPNQVRVTIDKAYTLSQADFSVQTKSDSSGSYNKTLQIGSVSDQAHKVYDILLADIHEKESGAAYNYIHAGDYVQVTIGKLNGVKAAETIYETTETGTAFYCSGTVGTALYDTLALPTRNRYLSGYSRESMATGYFKDVTVTGELPAGIHASIQASEGTVRFYGTPEKVAKGSKVTVAGTDEKGRRISCTAYFYIGSADTLVTYLEKEDNYFLVNDNLREEYYLHTVGGSGSYTYTWDESLDSETEPFVSFYSSGELDILASRWNIETGENDLHLKPGRYRFSYLVSDDEHTQVKTTGELELMGIQGTEVSGKVVASDGVGQEDVKIYASFTDALHQYYRSSGNFATTNETGEYTGYVVPEQEYQFTVISGSTEKTLYRQRVGSEQVVFDFQLPLNKIMIKTEDGAEIYSAYAYGVDREDDDYFEEYSGKSGDEDGIYLAPGPYEFVVMGVSGKKDWWNGYQKSLAWYRLNTVVDENTKEVTVKRSSSESITYTFPKAGDTTYQMVPGRTYHLWDTNVDEYEDEDEFIIVKYYAYYFEPTEDGEYTLEGTAYIYDTVGNKLEQTGGKYVLSKGNRYIIGNDGEDARNISIRK